MKKIYLCSQQPELSAAFARHCGSIENVTVVTGSILDIEVDAVVSPANSFGFMDGGIDWQYLEFFGEEVERLVQEKISAKPHGELLVGDAVCVPTGHPQIKWLVAAPTMRVPTILPPDTIAPFLAARAAISACECQSIAFPGMGTGVGRVPPDICARQMRAAILFDKEARPKTWHEAQYQHTRLYTDQMHYDLQQPPR
jgi:O-acetyl-ADP-ribose deacetylase (regulator of RNase III)